ncbi:MAG TPA: dTMP kinase [Candidatus Aminicenantes bacterium]|nr:dTMP kinase [Candidatus Aminicenantes bacterium]HEB36590.1 dTMP kinase [Candidatus Aminicenantes bacterium]
MVLQKGILIVFEGIDGSGKSTQAKILLERLQEEDFDAVYFREPSKGKWGRKIKKKALHPDSLSPEEELDLFQKDRRENVEQNLKPALKKKKIVILDRYYYSNIAYQGAKGIDEKLIRRMNEEFAVEPDLVFIFDIDPKKGLERIENRKKKDKLFEREDYLVKVREIFRSFKGEKFVHIDALKSEEEISKEIQEIALPIFL